MQKEKVKKNIHVIPLDVQKQINTYTEKTAKQINLTVIIINNTYIKLNITSNKYNIHNIFNR